MAIGTTAAILGSAAIGAGTSIIGGRNASRAQQRAAQAGQQASDAAIAEQRRQYDLARQDQQPWLTTGNSALQQLAGMYGLNTQPGGANASTYAFLQANPQARQDINAGAFGGPGNLDAATNWYRNEYGGAAQGGGTVTAGGYGAQTTPANPEGGAMPAAGGQAGAGGAMAPFFASPDYQFRLNEAMRGLTARNAALGIQDSGAAQRSALTLAGNQASGEFNNYANRLSALAGVGQSAANQNAAVGQNFAGAVGQIGMNNAQNLASSYQNQANINNQMWGNLGGIGAGLLGNFATSNATNGGLGGWGGSSLPNSAFRW